jgi:hypothetical protein
MFRVPLVYAEPVLFILLFIWLTVTIRYRSMRNSYLTCVAYTVMSKVDFREKLRRASEITLSVKGRKSGRDIPRPVWFVHEGDTLFAAKLRFGYQLVQKLPSKSNIENLCK